MRWLLETDEVTGNMQILDENNRRVATVNAGLKPYEDAVAAGRMLAAASDLFYAAEELLGLMDSVEVDPKLGDETDRVFPRYEFAALREAFELARGGV